MAIERRRKIKEYIQRERMVTVTSLMEMFSVSDMTIRRDFDELQKVGILKKVYGGAVLTDDFSNPQDVTFDIRSKVHNTEKTSIARRAAELIEPGDVIILDAGSTTFELAKRISPDSDLVVITNSIVIASELANKQLNLLVTGGEVRTTTRSLVGPKAKSFLTDLRARKLFLGVSALSVEQGLMNSNLYESEIKRQMIESAHEVIVLADSSKFDANSYHAFAQWKDIDIVITDELVPQKTAEQITQQGVKIIMVSVI